MNKAEMNARTCIVTREEKTPEEMIRFVLDPDHNVVPDLHRKLPGRGVWVTNNSENVKRAVQKNLFSRGFKQTVTANPTLADQVEILLEASVFELLPLARKAGLLVAGQAKVETLLREGSAGLIIHSLEAKGDGRRKLDKLTGSIQGKVDVLVNFSSEELDRVTGGVNTMHVALHNGGLTERVRMRLKNLVNYRRS